MDSFTVGKEPTVSGGIVALECQIALAQFLIISILNKNVFKFQLFAGYGINMWTINDEATMQECLNYKAGIITNYPDVAVALKNKK